MEDTIIKQIQDNYRNLTNTLISKNISISTMESCTSGLIASLITDTEGSSKVFKGSFVTYSNNAKIMCGVNPNVIKEYGVYSKQTSIEMAKTCKNKFLSDLSIGITGTFSNIDPNNSDSIIGEIYYTIIYKDITYSYHVKLPTIKDRRENKLYICNIICEQLNNLL